MTAIGLIGYAAAPRLAAIDDPTVEAHAAFTSSLGQFPLASDALNAVMLADSRRSPPAFTLAGGSFASPRGRR